MASVYMIGEDGATEAMKRIRCKNEDRELQQVLEKNPDLLPGDQINPDDPRRWLLIKREMPVPSPDSGLDRWSVDFLFADQDAVPTFVECKRFADTRSRREVVGQMLEYAANGHHYWSKDELRTFASDSATRAGTSLEDRVTYVQSGDARTIDDYFDILQQNLREGQLRIIFFLEESPQELRSVVDFLNRQMERSEVLLVEARQYLHAGLKVIVPTLFGYTEAARLVKRSVTVTTHEARKRWDRSAYFAEVGVRLNTAQGQAVEALLDACESLGCIVTWGVGRDYGSFSVKEPSIPYSIFACYTDGTLVLNLYYVTRSEAANRMRDRLRQLIAERLEISAGQNVATSVGIAIWGPSVAELVEVLQQVVAEARGVAPSSDPSSAPV